MDNKTAMMELRDKLLSVYEELKESSSEHLLGYSEALKNVANDIDVQMLKTERQQIEDAFVAGDERGTNNIPFNAEQYYNQTYTQNNNQ